MKNNIDDENTVKVNNCMFKSCLTNNKVFSKFVTDKKLEILSDSIHKKDGNRNNKNKSNLSKQNQIEPNFNCKRVKDLDTSIIDEIKLLENKNTINSNVMICSLHTHLIDISKYLSENYEYINEISDNISHSCKTKEKVLTDSLLCK